VGLRRVVFARIRELFEREGTRFASREVVVKVETLSGVHEMTRDQQVALGASAGHDVELADSSERKK
jgi:hypothetical protein